MCYLETPRTERKTRGMECLLSHRGGVTLLPKPSVHQISLFPLAWEPKAVDSSGGDATWKGWDQPM